MQQALDLAEERRGLGALWALDSEGAVAGAGRIDERHAAGELLGPLAGTPFVVKDMFDQAGQPTSGGLTGRRFAAAADAEAVARLRDAGAIPIGKSAMDPLACSTGGQAPGYPPCVNPLDSSLSPGGSSSGSAVAIAAGIVPLALGTDTAGSVRIPAAYCGVTGLKPVTRAISHDGCLRVMPSFDTPGVLAGSVALCARALSILSGQATPLPAPTARLRVGLLADLLEEADGEVAAACERAVAALGSETPTEPVNLDWKPTGLGVALACELAENWGEEVDREPDRFTDLIRNTIVFGRRVGEDDRRAAITSLATGREELGRRFGGFDALVCPTTPTPAPMREAETVRVSSRFTRVFNALDWPAISIPVPAPPGVAPIGLQVVGAPSRLGSVLEVARRIEAGGGRSS